MSKNTVSSRSKNATSYMVAQEAGVSQSAVSRTYKPGGSVSKATREKVHAAAKNSVIAPTRLPEV